MPKVGKDKDLTQKNVAFSKWLKGTMASEDVTYQQLAEYMGVSRQDINYHLREHKPFNYTQLVLIFDFLNVSPEQIVKLLTTRTKEK